jgi:hypothetical protein
MVVLVVVLVMVVVVMMFMLSKLGYVENNNLRMDE